MLELYKEMTKGDIIAIIGLIIIFMGFMYGFVQGGSNATNRPNEMLLGYNLTCRHTTNITVTSIEDVRDCFRD